MKIRNKYIFIVVFSFVMLACSKWGGDNPIGVTGGVAGWQDAGSEKNGENFVSALLGNWRHNISNNSYQIITLSPNGRFLLYSNDSNDVETFSGTYSVFGNKLNLLFTEENIIFTYSLNDDELILTNSDGERTTYYRIEM